MRTPHDELFRLAFGTAERARGLLRVALPFGIVGKLDLGFLRVNPGSYVDRRLRNTRSDLLLEIRSGGREPALVYVLFEHKSQPERGTPLQLLRYMVGIWEEWGGREENRGWRKLPPIIPVVFSQAPRRWNCPLELAELIGGPEGLDLGANTPRFRPVILDLAAKAEGELGEDAAVSGLLRIFKYAKAGPTAALRRAFVDIEGARTEPRLREALVRYLFLARQGRSFRSILGVLPEGEMRKGAMTVAEALEKKGEKRGRTAGRAEGRTEGRIQDKQDVLTRLMERKFGTTERERRIIRACVEAEGLDAAIDAVLPARTKAAVLRYLQSPRSAERG